MNRSEAFWDRVAEKYSSKPVSDEKLYQEKLEICRDYLCAEAEVLEIGCGTGSTALALAPSVGHIKAVDLSSKMIEIAIAKASEAGISNISFGQAAVEDLELNSGSIDTALAMNILHLVDDPVDAIESVHRMLMPGGVFISSTACLADRFWFLRPLLVLGRWLGFLPAISFFSREKLSKTIRDAGFDVERSYNPGGSLSLFVVARKLDPN